MLLLPACLPDAFNCVQRGHQNFLENVPCIIAMILLNWFTFPLISGICGILWMLCKVSVVSLSVSVSTPCLSVSIWVSRWHTQALAG